MAPVNTLSLNTSSHLSMVRFEVIMIEPASLREDNRLNNISPESLENDEYPNSS